MLVWNIIAAGFVPILALAGPAISNALDSNNFSCGTTPSEEFKEISKSLAKEEAIARRLGRRAVHEVQINVYMHIVASSEDHHDGNLSVSFELCPLLFPLRFSRISLTLFFQPWFSLLHDQYTNPVTRTKTSLTNSKSSKPTSSRRVSSSTWKASIGLSTLHGPITPTLSVCGTMFVMAAIPTSTYGLSLHWNTTDTVLSPQLAIHYNMRFTRMDARYDLILFLVAEQITIILGKQWHTRLVDEWEKSAKWHLYCLENDLLRPIRLAIGWAYCIRFKADAMVWETTLMILQRKQVRARDVLKGGILAPINRGWIPFTTIWIIHTSMFSKSFYIWLCCIPND